MTTPHPHAEFLRAIADGGLEATQEFECKRHSWDSYESTGSYFRSVIAEPDLWQVRRKPRTVKIGERVVPAGIAEAPEVGTTVYVTDTPASAGYIRHEFGSRWSFECLGRGIVHLSKEAALAMGEALIAVAKGEE